MIAIVSGIVLFLNFRSLLMLDTVKIVELDNLVRRHLR